LRNQAESRNFPLHFEVKFLPQLEHQPHSKEFKQLIALGPQAPLFLVPCSKILLKQEFLHILRLSIPLQEA
jgi:hypothetical protein